MAQAPQEKSRDFLATLRDVSLICAVYLYFVGWVYEYYFLGHFGLALTSVEIPVYYFFIYAFSALSYYFSFILIISAIVICYVAILVFLSLSSNVRSKLQKIGMYLLCVNLVMLFPVSFYGAKEAAETRAKEIRLGRYPSKTITLIFKKELADEFPKELTAANARGDLKLLTHTKDVYFVFRQIQNETPHSHAVPYGFTHHISKSDVNLLTVEMRGFSETEVP
jgi:hypothetical protein